MASVGGAAAQGLESGIGIGLRLRAQDNAEQQQLRANTLQDQQLQRQAELDKQGQDDRALDAVNKAFDDLRAEGEGYFAQYGKTVPDEIAGPYKQRVSEVSGTRNELLRKRYEPVIKQREQRARDVAMKLQAGSLDLKDVAAADLYDAVHVLTKRDPSDLLGTNGQPSRVSAAVADIHEGLEFNNEGAVLRGANVLLEPELKVGVGEPSPHGGTIVGKQIVKLIPHPDDPSKVLPVLKVYVRRGKPQSAGDVARSEHVAEEGAPPGATGYYIAPLTENRSTDPEDPPKAVDLNKAMDYAAQMQVLSSTLAHPDIAGKLAEGKKAAGSGDSDFMRAFYAVRGKMPAKQVVYESLKPGERKVGINPQTGAPTGQVLEGSPRTEKATGLAANIQAVQSYAEENGISEAEAAAQLQQQGLLRSPKGAKGGKGAGAGGGSGGGLSAKGEGLSGEEFLATLPPDEARIVKGLAEGTIKPESISIKGDRREKMLAKVSQYMPDGGGSGKPLPEPVRKVIVEARDNAATMDRMKTSFKPEFAGKGVLGVGADMQLDASARLGVDNESVQWWKNYRKQAQLVERHAMFGASLTTGEQAAWASADISPGQDPKVIEENLKTRAELTRKVLEYTRKDMIDAGHSEKRVSAIAGRAGLTAEPDTPQRKSGQVEQPGAAPMQLPSDRKAAAAAYAKLPSGATFIDPDGNTRRKP